MSSVPASPGTDIHLRVQVVDLTPRVLDLRVPTYLVASDLTQRIARDAGLGAWWPDGARRTFGLVVRGRRLGEQERLDDVGVAPWELVHLLPDPEPGAPVRERDPGFTVARAPRRWSGVVGSVGLAVAWGGLCAWTLAGGSGPSGAGLPVALAAGFGASWLSVAAARSGDGTMGVGFVLRSGLLAVPQLALLGWIAARAGASSEAVRHAAVGEGARLAVAVGVGGAAGGLGAVLAWLGPFEPVSAEGSGAGAVTVSDTACGICGNPVAAHVAVSCELACGKTFHRGCLAARKAAVGDDAGGACAVCGAVG